MRENLLLFQILFSTSIFNPEFWRMPPLPNGAYTTREVFYQLQQEHFRRLREKDFRIVQQTAQIQELRRDLAFQTQKRKFAEERAERLDARQTAYWQLFHRAIKLPPDGIVRCIVDSLKDITYMAMPKGWVNFFLSIIRRPLGKIIRGVFAF